MAIELDMNYSVISVPHILLNPGDLCTSVASAYSCCTGLYSSEHLKWHYKHMGSGGDFFGSPEYYAEMAERGWGDSRAGRPVDFGAGALMIYMGSYEVCSPCNSPSACRPFYEVLYKNTRAVLNKCPLALHQHSRNKKRAP